MKLFDIIKKNCEEKRLAKAQKIEAEKQRLEHERQAQIEKEQQELQKLLNSKIPKEFVIRLSHDLYKKGKYQYTLYEYFVCYVKPKDMKYGQWTKARKVSGTDFGKVFEMCVRSSPFSPSTTQTELYIGNMHWEGDRLDNVYIPVKCVTIADLRDYAQKDNENIIKGYEEDLKPKISEEDIRNQFFK